MEIDAELLKESGWLDGRTRAVIVSFNVLNPSLDFVMKVEALTEFDSAGYMQSISRSLPVVIHPYATTIQQFLLMVKVLCIVAVLALLLIQLSYYSSTRKILRQELANNQRRVCSSEARFSLVVIAAWLRETWAVFDIFIVATFSIARSWELYTFFSADRVLDVREFGYQDLTQLAHTYEDRYIFLTLALLFAVIKMLKFFKVQRQLSVLITAFVHASRMLCTAIVLIAMLVLVFSLVAFQFYGRHLSAFRSFDVSVRSLILLLFGGNTFGEMARVRPYFSPPFYFSFLITVWFLVMNIFFSIMIHEHALTIQQRRRARRNSGSNWGAIAELIFPFITHIRIAKNLNNK